MPDIRNRMDSELTKYDAMSTGELQQLLREDASKPVGEESDLDVLLYIMEVLAKRRKGQNEGKPPAEALESFKLNYDTEKVLSSDPESVPAAPKRRSNGRWIRSLIATAAMLIFIIGGSLTANAMGFDLWETIAKWTQETFHFGYAEQADDTNVPNPDYANPCASLKEVLDKYNVHLNLVPSWIPSGYEETDIRVLDSPLQREFIAKYQLADDSIRIRIAYYLEGAPEQIEQSDSLLEIYTVGHVEYYIFSNYDQMRAVWIIDDYECYITGPISIAEIKKMIDSIG